MLLAGSGWETVFVLADVFTSGVASSLLNGKHVKRTRYAYHLTLARLHILECQAYAEYKELLSLYDVPESFDAWEKRQCKRSRTFCFWITVKHFLILVSRFVRGQRQGDWDLTLKACWSLASWYFGCSKWNYSRWNLVFVRNMVRLSITHPDVHSAFSNGLFVVQRSSTKFSWMALDQSQEYSVRHLKDGGSTKRSLC